MSFQKRLGVWVALGVALALLGCHRAKVERLDPALDQLIAPDAKVEKVAGGFVFNEGPMWREGRLWFSDLGDNKIYAVSPDGKAELLLDHAGGLEHMSYALGFQGSNAMATDKDGSVLVCQQGLRRIVRVDEQMHITNFLDRWNGRRFNSPNDLVFAPDGSLWFTDPPYGLGKLDRDPAKEIPFSGVYRYQNGELTAVIQDLPYPNGIGFSPDGKILYVSNSQPHMFVNRYDVKADGTLGAPTVLIRYPDDAKADVPDGLKIDSAGNVWTTGPGGIRIVTPQGKVLGQIRLPRTASNLAWGGDGHMLYIAATHSIYRLHTVVAGEMPLYMK